MIMVPGAGGPHRFQVVEVTRQLKVELSDESGLGIYLDLVAVKAARLVKKEAPSPAPKRAVRRRRDVVYICRTARRLLSEGYSKRHIAKLHGVAESTLRRWLKCHEEEFGSSS